MADYLDTITIKELPVLNGLGKIKGRLLNDGSFANKTEATGDPVPGIDVSLEQIPGGKLIAHDVTTDTTSGKSAGGYYEFDNVPSGNYRIFVSIAGVPLIQTYDTLITGTEQADNLDFYVGDKKIYVKDKPLSALVQQNRRDEAAIYPNPFRGYSNIVYTLNKTEKVLIEVYDIVGNKIAVLENSEKQAGKHSTILNLKSFGYAAGVYFVRINTGNNTQIIKAIEAGDF